FGLSPRLLSPSRTGHRRSSWSGRSTKQWHYVRPGPDRSVWGGSRSSPDGFDFGNSPLEVSTVNLQGEAIIQRTSAGTEGIVEAATKAERLYAAWLVPVNAARQRLLSGSTNQPQPEKHRSARSPPIAERFFNSTLLQQPAVSPDREPINQPPE